MLRRRTNVRHESRCGELTNEADCSSLRKGRRPQSHQRVAVEERHAAVADVVAVDVVLGAVRVGQPRQTPLAAPHCLGHSGSARGEEKQEQRRRVDTEVDLRRLDVMCCNLVRVRRVVDQDETIFGQPEVQAGKLLVACFVGDDQLAVDVPDLSLEFSSTPGRIDADDRGPGQGRAAEPEQELRIVLEKNSDVKRSGRAKRLRKRAARCALAHHLVPAPVLRPRPQTQVLITETVDQHLRDVLALRSCKSCIRRCFGGGVRHRVLCPSRYRNVDYSNCDTTRTYRRLRAGTVPVSLSGNRRHRYDFLVRFCDVKSATIRKAIP